VLQVVETTVTRAVKPAARRLAQSQVELHACATALTRRAVVEFRPDLCPSWRQRGREDRARPDTHALARTMRGQQDGADDRGDNRRDDYREPESAVRGARARRGGRHPFIIHRAARGFHRTRRDPRDTLSRTAALCDDCNRAQTRVDRRRSPTVSRRRAGTARGAGYVVAGEAADATEAHAAVVAEPPDVVLLDVQLSDGDGFAVAAALAGVDGPAVVLISSREAATTARESPHAERSGSSRSRSSRRPRSPRFPNDGVESSPSVVRTGCDPRPPVLLAPVAFAGLLDQASRCEGRVADDER